ncbi:P-loop containing nucleoside triphosphate hydrolase protein [Paraphysoderma sedebokerense]|nr:P-loop containing nucleoside triphosphate hydrolase protein [Paraphysoderma sedebokerense]KAI9138205.1 P-loop containing nucleoside triphosphate hydrolase protein [Paraphysoderma sedebokerense]
MTSSRRVKIALIGPPQSGKTCIANYLASIDSSLRKNKYRPTVGVRILEFDRKIKQTGSTKSRSASDSPVTVTVELWDCSGNENYEGNWSSLIEDADGICFTINADSSNVDADLLKWHSQFNYLKDQQSIIFLHKMQNPNQSRSKFKLPKALAKISAIYTSLDVDADTMNIQSQFDRLLSNCLAK